MSFGKPGVSANRVAVGRDGLLRPAHASVGIAKVIVDLCLCPHWCMRRRERERLEIALNGRVELTALLVRVAAQAKRIGKQLKRGYVLGFADQCLAKIIFCLAVLRGALMLGAAAQQLIDRPVRRSQSQSSIRRGAPPA